MTSQRPNEIKGSAFCCDIVKPVFAAFFPPLPDPPPQPPRPPDDEVAPDYSNDPLGDFGYAVCRTNWIGAGLTTIPFQPSEVNKDGYFQVDPMPRISAACSHSWRSARHP